LILLSIYSNNITIYNLTSRAERKVFAWQSRRWSSQTSTARSSVPQHRRRTCLISIARITTRRLSTIAPVVRDHTYGNDGTSNEPPGRYGGRIRVAEPRRSYLNHQDRNVEASAKIVKIVVKD